MSEETIFAQALSKASAAEREAYLAQACGADAKLRSAVEALLAAHERTGGGILDAPLPTIETTAVGATIGPYKLLQQLGEGGMGVVYMAEQTAPVRRTVAIKIIRPGLDTRQVVARFEAERQALAMMDHPNIARVFDAGTTDTGRPYFVMELVRGIPITEYCDQHQLTPRQRLELFVPVCQAVQHAHQKGIVHRDLKPNNVLITLQDGDKPTPKVIDFGIAKAIAGQRLTDLTLVTELRQLIGTPLYMSPEQAEMNALMDVDTRSDVYSLGVLLYELLTGTTPFDKQRLATAAFDEVRRIIREEEPPRPSTRLSTLGDALTTVSIDRATDPKKLSQTMRGELDWIVMKALEKDRGRRYETASGLARDIERYLADESVEACPPSRIYRLRKTIRRNKPALTAAAIIALVLLSATAVSTWEAVRAQRAERVSSHERDEAQAQKKRADQQADIAQAVNDFLNDDVLSEASPYKQLGESKTVNRDLKVREALDRASSRIAGRFPNQPLVEAGVRHALGSAYLDLGEFKSAQPHLEIALQLRQKFAGEQDPQTLKTATALAELYKQDIQWDKAVQVYQYALGLAGTSLGESHRETLKLMSQLAWVYSQQGDYGQAEPLCVRALALYQQTHREEDEDEIVILAVLGEIYLQHRDYSKAQPFVLKTLSLERKFWGEEEPGTSLRLAVLYEDNNQPAKAEPLYHQVIEHDRRVLGELHPDTLRAMSNLSIFYANQREWAKAEELCTKVLEADRKVRGPEHPTTLFVQQNLGWIYLSQGKYDQAEKLLLQTVDAKLRRGDGAWHAKWYLAQLYHQRGDKEKEEKYLLGALDHGAWFIPKLGYRDWGMKDELGLLYLEEGKYDKAEPYLIGAFDSAHFFLGEQSDTTRELREHLFKLYTAWGKPAQATTWPSKFPATQPATPIATTTATRQATASTSRPFP